MFLVMAIFERLIHTTTTLTNSHFSLGLVLSESLVGLSGFAFSKFGFEFPKVSFFFLISLILAI
ncbi:hypothetical protein Bca52824_069307 [Brassica carinata]|uniref:Uncharacterized protein n=1 Tax=Brassica carinata TaxID=52824 RepID=A0A8X7Q3H7_BRACI|nr:hypothetical protein Bca52824_069307 [Brassica carinata]